MHHLFTAFLIIATATSSFQPIVADEWAPPASLESLSANPELPELFLFADGRPVKTTEDWQLRRKEMQAILQYYQYGHLPPRPDSIKVENLESRILADGQSTEQTMTLVLGDLPWWTRSEQRASLGVIATRVHHESGPLVIAIASRTAVLLGQTSAWPCTDIGIGFGDPRPGETVVRAGRIYFLQGDLDDLRERIRTDFEM